MKFKRSIVGIVMAAMMMSTMVVGMPVSAVGTVGNGYVIADFDTTQSYEEWLEEYKDEKVFEAGKEFTYDKRYRLISNGSVAKIMDVEQRHTVKGFIKTNIGIFYAKADTCELYNGLIKSGNKYYICKTGLLDGKFYTKSEAKKKEGVRCNITAGPNKGKVFVATPYTSKSIKLFKSTFKALTSKPENVMGEGVYTNYFKRINGVACIDNAARTDTFSKSFSMAYRKGRGFISIPTGKAEGNDYKYNIYVKYKRGNKLYKKELGILGTDEDGILSFAWSLPKEVTTGAVYIETESMVATFGFGPLNKTKSFKNAVHSQGLTKGFFNYLLAEEYKNIISN